MTIPPGQWPYGYVPSAGEWDAAFSNIARTAAGVSVIGDLVSYSTVDGTGVQDSGVSVASVTSALPLILGAVPTVAALRAATSTTLPRSQSYVLGYAANADGGEGAFVYVSTDTTSADNGGTIIVDASGRRWYRLTGGQPFSVKWFGATGNGTTDDTAAIQETVTAAIAAGRGVCLPKGNYVVSAPITGVPTAGMKFFGDGAGVTFISPTSLTTDVFVMTSGSTTPIEMCDFTVAYSSTSSTAGTIFNFTGGCGGLNFHDITTFNGWNVLTLGSGSASQSFSIDNLTFDAFLNDGLYIELGSGNPGGLGFISRVLMNCSTSNAAGFGILLSQGQSITFSDMQIQGMYSPIAIFPAAGALVTDCKFTRVYADNAARARAGNSGWTIGGNGGNLHRIDLCQCWAGACGGAGFNISAASQIALVNCDSIVNAGAGITIATGCSDITVSECRIVGNSYVTPGSYSGIAVNGVCTNIKITNNRSGPSSDFTTASQEWGIIVGSGATNQLVISNNLVTGNIAGGVSNGATGGSQYVVGNLT